MHGNHTKKLSDRGEINSYKDGFEYIHSIVIPVSCQCIFYLIWSISKYSCHPLPLEVFTTAEEIVLFHAHGPFMFRYSCSDHESSNAVDLFDRLDDRGARNLTQIVRLRGLY